jgi:hypothetical protein
MGPMESIITGREVVYSDFKKILRRNGSNGDNYSIHKSTNKKNKNRRGKHLRLLVSRQMSETAMMESLEGSGPLDDMDDVAAVTGIGGERGEDGSRDDNDDDDDDEGSLAHHSTGDGDGGTDSDALKEQLAHRETRAVFQLRVLVFAVLLCAATAVSVVVYFITAKAQTDEFGTQYKGSAEKIVEAFEGIVKQKLGAISAVGVAMIAHGVDHTRTWPFVTLSSFQQRSSTARSLSGALLVSMNHYVNETKRLEWEHYVTSNDSYWM